MEDAQYVIVYIGNSAQNYSNLMYNLMLDWTGQFYAGTLCTDVITVQY